jgi:DNA-binding CsgD family transcriptional regulator
VAVGLALSTLSVICFPDGRLPSAAWRRVTALVLIVAAGCSGLSALWPVEYAATGVVTDHPLDVGGLGTATSVWTGLAHPAYTVFQLLWVVAVAMRWRASGRLVRVQLAWVGLAVTLSTALLVVGLAVWGTPRLGLLSAALVPVAAGWAIVHGQHLAAYSALSWLSRAGTASQDLPTELARATAEALAAGQATLWIGKDAELHAVGGWPNHGASTAPNGEPVGIGAVSLAALRAAPSLLLRPVTREGSVIGAITVSRPDRLSLIEEQLFDDLAAQAVLVIEHLALLQAAARQRATGDIGELSPRERQVLELMAGGLSNAAICAQLHLSIKTVEPVVSAIFTKLGLNPDSDSNRRVLAVLAFLRS